LKVNPSIRLLALWLRYPNFRRFELQNNGVYWIIRWSLSKLSSFFRLRYYSSLTTASDCASSTSLALQTLFALKGRLASSLILSLALLLADQWLGQVEVISQPKVDQDSLPSVLTTLAQVSATMLGLYFAAISVVASSAYARAPGEIRRLVVADEVGSLYFGLLSYFCVISVAMMLADLFGGSVGNVSMLALAFFGITGIVGFSVLGLRTFDLFDPGELVGALNRRMRRLIVRAARHSFGWRNANVQVQHSESAFQIIQSYDSLITLAAEKEHLSPRPLVRLGAGLLQIWEWHSASKGRIPSDSQWFRRRLQHRRWLNSYSTATEIARTTNTSLPPEEAPDILWLEHRLSGGLARIFRALLNRQDSSEVSVLLSILRKRVLASSCRCQYDEALELLESIGDLLGRHYREQRHLGAGSSTGMRAKMEHFDLVSVAFIDAGLGIAYFVRENSVEDAVSVVTRIRWKYQDEIYRTGPRPRCVIQKWEDLYEKLAVEIHLEGRVTSPLWLLCEATARGYSKSLARCIDIITAQEKWFLPIATELESAKDYATSALVALRGLECCNKWAAHIDSLQKWVEACGGFNRSKDDPWPQTEFPSLTQRCEEMRKQLLTLLSRLLMHLSLLAKEPDFPDLFGQTYTVTLDRCLEALIRREDDAFLQIFPRAFEAVLEAHSNAIDQHRDEPTKAFRMSNDPLGDLLAISGYGLLMSEITGGDIREFIKAVWDSYLSSRGDEATRRRVIERLGMAIEEPQRLSPRGLARFEWTKQFNKMLHEKGVLEENELLFRRPSNQVSGLLLSVYLPHSGLYGAEVLFTAAYLAERPEASGIEFGHDVESLIGHIKRMRNAREEGEDGDE